ncbi:hypothetical protein [Nocardia altamirensis]|uniref:hypothetical protein n=1 Tax=Nocardia altamirensis TaxID=472158 RepID=UPI001435596F|nr:hypothetical protein [Nocardia altamirensis]
MVSDPSFRRLPEAQLVGGLRVRGDRRRVLFRQAAPAHGNGRAVNESTFYAPSVQRIAL